VYFVYLILAEPNVGGKSNIFQPKFCGKIVPIYMNVRGFVRSCTKTSFCRFLGSFEPIFDFFLWGLYQTFVYYPHKKNQKAAKIIPKSDEALVLVQLLRLMTIKNKIGKGLFYKLLAHNLGQISNRCVKIVYWTSLCNSSLMEINLKRSCAVRMPTNCLPLTTSRIGISDRFMMSRASRALVSGVTVLN
jgi:hypothetical protein